MYDDFELDNINTFKRSRSEEGGIDEVNARPQAKYAAELVEVYFVKTSKIECEEQRKKGNEIYSLEDLVPSLSQRVGAIAHHFQIIKEKSIPLTFARSILPKEPPKRPFLATILAVIIQLFVFENSGVYISLSTFDNWFNYVNQVEGYHISKCWLDAKLYVAKKFASKTRIKVYGQEILWKNFDRIEKISTLYNRIFWIIQASVEDKNKSLYDNEIKNSDFSFIKEFQVKQEFEFYVSRNSFLWPIWSEVFISLSISKFVSIDDKLLIAEKAFIEGINKCGKLFSFIIDLLNNLSIDININIKISDSYLLCSATSGEFAAITIFYALKNALNNYFLNKPTTKQGVELSAEIMSNFFDKLIQFYLFLPSSSRHYNLLDLCQRLWQSSGTLNQANGTIQPFNSQRKKRNRLVIEEDFFFNSNTLTITLDKEEKSEITPLFSKCVLNSFRSIEDLEKLINCIQIQKQEVEENSINVVNSISKEEKISGESPNSFKSVSEALSECNKINVWCTLELPIEDEKGNLFLKDFLRNNVDSLLKEKVDNATAMSRGW